jgi:hypothetical protein
VFARYDAAPHFLSPALFSSPDSSPPPLQALPYALCDGTCTPLMRACAAGAAECVSALLQARLRAAPPCTCDCKRETECQCAAESELREELSCAVALATVASAELRPASAENPFDALRVMCAEPRAQRITDCHSDSGSGSGGSEHKWSARAHVTRLWHSALWALGRVHTLDLQSLAFADPDSSSDSTSDSSYASASASAWRASALGLLLRSGMLDVGSLPFDLLTADSKRSAASASAALTFAAAHRHSDVYELVSCVRCCPPPAASLEPSPRTDLMFAAPPDPAPRTAAVAERWAAILRAGLHLHCELLRQTVHSACTDCALKPPAIRCIVEYLLPPSSKLNPQ